MTDRQRCILEALADAGPAIGRTRAELANVTGMEESAVGFALTNLGRAVFLGRRGEFVKASMSYRISEIGRAALRAEAGLGAGR